MPAMRIALAWLFVNKIGELLAQWRGLTNRKFLPLLGNDASKEGPYYSERIVTRDTEAHLMIRPSSIPKLLAASMIRLLN